MTRGANPEAERAALIQHHDWAMRRIRQSRQRLERFYENCLFFERSPIGVLKYLGTSWRLAWDAELVLITTPQARIEFLAEYIGGVTARVRGADCMLYSETWRLPEGWRHGVRRLALRATFRLASVVVVPGSRHAILAHTLVRRHAPVRVVGSPFCEPPELKRLVRSHEQLRLLYCSRIFPLKGLDVLVTAVSQLLEQGRDVWLTVVDAADQSQWLGKDPWYRERCLADARALLGERLDVVRPVDAVEELFSRHDVLVMPNREMKGERVPAESWGRLIEEALTSGCPVIATDAVASAYDLILNGVNGFMVPSGEADALAHAIDQFIQAEAAHAE